MGASSCLSILPSDVLMRRCEPGGRGGGWGCNGGAGVGGGQSQRERARVYGTFSGVRTNLGNSKLGTAVAGSQCLHGH